jgi:hypothetical protein
MVAVAVGQVVPGGPAGADGTRRGGQSDPPRTGAGRRDPARRTERHPVELPGPTGTW